MQQVFDAGLCTQCGTCEGVCPTAAVTLVRDRHRGYAVRVDGSKCTDCGICLDTCPGEGLDFTAGAWWRARNEGAPAPDFLGPWRSLWFGWAADETTRFAGASGGVATALLQEALEQGLINAAAVCRVDPTDALAIEPVLARSTEEIAACRGSKYNVVAMNTLLRRLLDDPGRYAFIGLPCHIQGLRKAQERNSRLRRRVVFTLGIFCGWQSEPRATEMTARRAGLDPAELTAVRYRGPDWPGGMRLETRSGQVWERPYPAYFDRLMWAYTPPRCRLCPDALAELADISLGDAWLQRFKGTPGVSDVIVRTPVGETVLARLAPGRVVLHEATADEILRSQAEAIRLKRHTFRGRLWLRSLVGRPVPRYPGINTKPSGRERVRGIADLVQESLYRTVGDLRYR